MGCVQSSYIPGSASDRTIDTRKLPGTASTSDTPSTGLSGPPTTTRPQPAATHPGPKRGQESPEADHPINWNLQFSELRVSEHIANGGYCTVLACELNGENRAVKIPLANCQDPEGAVADILNEIRILKRLRHPNLCAVYGAGGWRKPGDLPFLVLEQLQYQNLAQQCGTDVDEANIKTRIMQRITRTKLPFQKRLDFGVQLAELLKYLHAEGIPEGFVVHRDLKPSNIGLSKDGRLKVFDFGLARLKEQRDSFTDKYVMTGQTGSQRFMAPEVFDGVPYNEKVDIFSYGIVLWEICALQKPFVGMSSHQHAKKVFRGGLRPPLDKRWPKGLRTLMERCWHTNPDVRPEAGQVVEMIKAVLSLVDSDENGTFAKM